MPTATILGTEYQTVVMPDGRKWMAENLSFVDGSMGRFWNNGISDDGDGTYYLNSDLLYLRGLLSGGPWRIPTKDELLILRSALLALYPSNAGGCLKTTGTTYWDSPNSGADNVTGFALRGAGYYSNYIHEWRLKRVIGQFCGLDSGDVLYTLGGQYDDSNISNVGPTATTGDRSTLRLIYDPTLQPDLVIGSDVTVYGETKTNAVLLEDRTPIDTSNKVHNRGGFLYWGDEEITMGLPAADDYILSRTTAGVNSWVPHSMGTGVVVDLLPALTTDGGAGTVTVAALKCQLHDNANFFGQPLRYQFSETTLTLSVDGTRYIVYAYLNSGTPTIALTTDSTVPNQSDKIALYFCTKIGTTIHSIGFDTTGAGQPQKEGIAIINTEPYRRSVAGGMMISEDGVNRNVLCSASVVYAGSTPNTILAYTSVSDKLTYVSKVSSAWAYATTATGGAYNNTEYQGATNPVTMGASKWKCVWVYRSVGDDKECFYVNGSAEYNSSSAAALEKMPSSLPPLLMWHCMLIGRIIVQKSATSGIVESAFGTTFTAGAVTNHNDLANIQGGAAGDYRHLTAVQAATIAADGSLVLPKASGLGIKVDHDSPTYGWADLIGQMNSRETGTTSPAWATWRGTIKQYQFATSPNTSEIVMEYHVPHDYAPGTDMFIHTHWSHITAGTPTGTISVSYEHTFAKGFNQEAFPATKTITHASIAPGAQYRHMVSETQLSSNGGSATLLDSSLIEVDGLIIVKATVSANSLSGGTLPFIHKIDIHYQSTNATTKNKAPNFYA